MCGPSPKETYNLTRERKTYASETTIECRRVIQLNT